MVNGKGVSGVPHEEAASSNLCAGGEQSGCVGGKNRDRTKRKKPGTRVRAPFGEKSKRGLARNWE